MLCSSSSVSSTTCRIGDVHLTLLAAAGPAPQPNRRGAPPSESASELPLLLRGLERANVFVDDAAVLELLQREILGAADLAEALLSTARAVEALRHVPLGAGVEERDVVAGLEALGTHGDLPPGRRAGVQAHLGRRGARVVHWLLARDSGSVGWTGIGASAVVGHEKVKGVGGMGDLRAGELTEQQVRVELEVVVLAGAELHGRVGLDGGDGDVLEGRELLSGGVVLFCVSHHTVTVNHAALTRSATSLDE